MLLNESEPFDSPDYIFELKLDGLRAVLYYDGTSVRVRNKRNDELIERYPELKRASAFIKKPCVLDGEIICTTNGKPDFSKLQKRALLANAFKIKLAEQSMPVQFVAYDILQVDKKVLIECPLIERKAILERVVVDCNIISKSRYIETQGKAFFALTKEQGLEGIVAKRKDSHYYLGKRSSVWLKIKALLDDDFLICGYKLNDQGELKDVLLLRDLSKTDVAHFVDAYVSENGNCKDIADVNSNNSVQDKQQAKQNGKLTIINYKGKSYQYMGSVAMGISQQDKAIILEFARAHPANLPLKISGAHFIEPKLVGTVIYMLETASGHLRQPVFKGLRFDK